jgi:hypothetical protein
MHTLNLIPRTSFARAKAPRQRRTSRDYYSARSPHTRNAGDFIFGKYKFKLSLKAIQGGREREMKRCKKTSPFAFERVEVPRDFSAPLAIFFSSSEHQQSSCIYSPPHPPPPCEHLKVFERTKVVCVHKLNKRKLLPSSSSRLQASTHKKSILLCLSEHFYY